MRRIKAPGEALRTHNNIYNMPTTFVDDNMTVIEESSRSQGPSGANGNGKEPANGKGKGQLRPVPTETRLKGQNVSRTSEFMQPLHVPEEGRPFFVPIGRGGVIAALDVLNKQLNEVR